MNRRRSMAALLAGGALFSLFLVFAAPASAQDAIIACAARRTGFDPNLNCPTNCCLTVIPTRTVLGVAAGLCVPEDLCTADPTEGIDACSSGPSVLHIGPSAKCVSNCCLTLIPHVSGLCVPTAIDSCS